MRSDLRNLLGKRSYDLLRKVGEYILDRLYWRGWPAALAYRLGWQPHVTLQTYTFAIPANGSPRPPLRLAFATDFHAGPTTYTDVLMQACAALRAAQPDVLLLGGDFVSFHKRYMETLLAPLRAIPAPLGRFAVLGNHDYWADHRCLQQQLATAHIRVLVNESYRLPAPYDDTWICGLDDPDEGQPDVDRAFGAAGPTRVVLMHSPQNMRDLETERFTLAVCGHTHGGQIGLPSGKPLFVPPGEYCRTYPAGHFVLNEDAGKSLIVSRGIGCSTVPIRLYAPPDVTLCVFTYT